MRGMLLSTTGGDRATAYAMSNKIVPLGDDYLCTWLDRDCQNQWAIVDSSRGAVRERGPLGTPGVDNHCGAALVLAGDSVHALIGSHHGPFAHYRMLRSQPGAWARVATIEASGTYPSVAADAQGRIHLAFRTPGDKWTLACCRFHDEQWTPAQHLVIADKPGYIYWTNGLTVDAADALHLLFGNTRVREDGALLYAASHLVSRDHGDTWCDDHGVALRLPAPAAAIPLMVAEPCPARVETLAEQQARSQPGPHHFHYHQLLLSNPVVAPAGTLCVVLHNGLTGEADLMRRSPTGGWTATPLTAAATHGDPSRRIHMQSSLALLPDGRLRAALMLEPTAACVWGAPGTSIVLVETGADGAPRAGVPLTPSDPTCAQWLPAQPHSGPVPPRRPPPLLHTRGVNAGGFAHNRNPITTDVFFCHD